MAEAVRLTVREVRDSQRDDEDFMNELVEHKPSVAFKQASDRLRNTPSLARVALRNGHALEFASEGLRDCPEMCSSCNQKRWRGSRMGK